MPSEEEQVIAHELIHVRKLHSADNLFIEALKAILWFNPFIYLFGKALCQAHEFEVDHCLTKSYNAKKYAGLLLKLSSPGSISLLNQFSAYGLTTRIGMLFAKPSAAAKKASYLLILPVLAALIYFLGVDKVYAHTKGAITAPDFVLVLDAGHGGKTGGVAPNGITEESLALLMVKQIKVIAERRGIKTILTRNDNRNVPLEARLIPQGDIFVSVHFNSAVKGPEENNGIMLLTARRNHNQQSVNLANTFKETLQHLNGIVTDTGIRRQGIKVLEDNKRPAILVELGYLTNTNDLKYITNKDNQHDMAEKFVDAVVAYKNQYASK